MRQVRSSQKNPHRKGEGHPSSQGRHQKEKRGKRVESRDIEQIKGEKEICEHGECYMMLQRGNGRSKNGRRKNGKNGRKCELCVTEGERERREKERDLAFIHT